MEKDQRLNDLEQLLCIIKDHAKQPSKYRKEDQDEILGALEVARIMVENLKTA